MQSIENIERNERLKLDRSASKSLIQWTCHHVHPVIDERADKISKLSCESTVNHSVLIRFQKKDFFSLNDTNFTKNIYRRSVPHSKSLDIFHLKLT